MARKITPTTKSSIKSTASRGASKTAPVSTPVRNTAIPKATPAAKKSLVITHEAIAQRAYEIYLSGSGGSETDNWHRAERELRGTL